MFSDQGPTWGSIFDMDHELAALLEMLLERGADFNKKVTIK